MKRALLVLVLLLLLAAPLVVVFRDLGRLVTLEAMRLVWTVRLLLEGLPQFGLWLALLVIILATAVANLAGRPARASGDEDGAPAESPGQVWELSRWIRRAAMGEYSRWTLHRYVEGLLWEAMATHQGASAAELKRRYRAGELAVEPDVAAFLEAAERKRFRRAAGRGGCLRFLRLRAGARPSVPPLERIAAFMEEQLAPGTVPHISLQPEEEHEPDTG